MNNSGRSQRGLAVNTDLEVDQSMFEINFMGTVSLTKVVLPHMIERKNGHIVVVSSVAGKIGKIYNALKNRIDTQHFKIYLLILTDFRTSICWNILCNQVCSSGKK